jgi:hypothetical protein
MENGQEFRVITGAQLREVARHAAGLGFAPRVSIEVAEMAEPDAVMVARVDSSCGVMRSPLSPAIRARIIIDPGDNGEPFEVTSDVLAAVWEKLPTVAEFDAELDLLEAAVRGTR